MNIQTSDLAGTLTCDLIYTITANIPPVINGSMEVYVTSGQTFMTSYTISDEDSNILPTIELKVSTTCVS